MANPEFNTTQRIADLIHQRAALIEKASLEISALQCTLALLGEPLVDLGELQICAPQLGQPAESPDVPAAGPAAGLAGVVRARGPGGASTSLDVTEGSILGPGEAAAPRWQPRTCPYCHEEFAPRTTNQKMCGKLACRSKRQAEYVAAHHKTKTLVPRGPAANKAAKKPARPPGPPVRFGKPSAGAAPDQPALHHDLPPGSEHHQALAATDLRGLPPLEAMTRWAQHFGGILDPERAALLFAAAGVYGTSQLAAVRERLVATAESPSGRNLFKAQPIQGGQVFVYRARP